VPPNFAFRAIPAVCADADAVIVLGDGLGIASECASYVNSYAWIMRMRAGKVIDGTALYDSVSFNDLCT
jgi:uncharacterized protein